MEKIMTIHSHMIHLEKSVLPLLVIQYPTKPHHNSPQCLCLENNIYVFKLKGKVTMRYNVLNKEHQSNLQKKYLISTHLNNNVLLLGVVAVRTIGKHMAAIGFDQSLSNSALYEPRFI